MEIEKYMLFFLGGNKIIVILGNNFGDFFLGIFLKIILGTSFGVISGIRFGK